MSVSLIPGQYNHTCVRCGAPFVSNVRQQYFCMNCRPPALKGKLGSKIDGFGRKVA